MNRNLLKSTLHNISEIQSIPREQRTVKQEKALTRELLAKHEFDKWCAAT